VERGSLRRPTDGDEDDGEEVVVGGVDERWPEWDFGSVSSRGRRGGGGGSSWYSGFGQKRIESGCRQ
jgi:hypothetical protein